MLGPQAGEYILRRTPFAALGLRQTLRYLGTNLSEIRVILPEERSGLFRPSDVFTNQNLQISLQREDLRLALVR